MLTPPDPEEDRAVPRRVTRLLVVAAILLGVLGSGLAWAFASPLTASPDDGYHHSSIWCPPPAEDSGCNVDVTADGRVQAVEVPAILVVGQCFQFRADVSAVCQETITPDGTHWATHFDRGEYPGGYYRVMSWFVGEDPTSSVLVMRSVNVVLAVALLGSILLTVGTATRRMGIFALVVSVVPMGMFVIASVNPSAWGLTGLLGVFLALHGSFVADSPRRRWVLIALAVVSAGIAASSRGDVGAYTVMVSVLVAFLHAAAIRRQPTLLVAPAVAMLIGVLGYLSADQAGAVSGIGEETGRDPTATFMNNVLEIPALILGMFGLDGLGWLDTRMPAVVWATMLIVVGGIVMTGLKWMDWRKGLAVGGIAVVLVALPLFILQQNQNIVGEQVQARYLLPLMPILLCVLLLVDRAGSIRFTRAQALTIWALVSIANSAALHANINRYTVGLDVRVFNLNDHLEWWWDDFPIAPMTLWILGSVFFGLGAWSVVLVRGTTCRTFCVVAADTAGSETYALPGHAVDLAHTAPDGADRDGAVGRPASNGAIAASSGSTQEGSYRSCDGDE